MDPAAGRPGRAEGEAAIVPGRALGFAAAALGLAAAALAASPALAQGEHARRLAAELAVMAGDLRRLSAAAEPPHRLQGLRARLGGALASLPLLLRQAGHAPERAQIDALRSALAASDWRTLDAGLAGLRKRHPLELGGILPAAPTRERLALGKAIHRQACAGCHDHPATGAALPARNLFKEAGELPPEEFAARLRNGVRGDSTTGLRNPFGDVEIGALLAYYGTGSEAGKGRHE